PATVDGDAQTATQAEVAQLSGAAPGHLDDGQSVESVLGEYPLRAGHPHPVDHHHQVRQAGAWRGARGERRTAPDVRGEHGFDPGQGELREAYATSAVGVHRMFVMREPFEPLPGPARVPLA